MPIRLIDASANLGRVQTTLADAAPVFTGTFTLAPGRTGTAQTGLSPVTSLLVGNFQSNANRVGTIGTTLAGHSSSLVGTFVQPGAPYQSVRTFATSYTEGEFDRAKILANSSTALGSFWATGEGTLELFMQPISGNTAASVATGSGQYTWIWGNIIVDRDRYNQLPGWGLSLTDGRVTFGLKTSAGQYTARGTSDTRTATQLIHVAVQRNATSGRIRIWVNYTLEVDVTGPTGTLAYPAGATPLNLCGPNENLSCSFSDPFIVIGAEKHRAPGVLGFNGIWSEVRFSSVARYSASTITPLTGRFSNDASTVGLFSCDETSGNTLLDKSTNANHGSLIVGGTNNGPQRSLTGPVYSGSITHGQSFTVSGSGFGTKSSNSLVWDNCSHGQAITSRWSSYWPDASGASLNLGYRAPQRSVALPHSNVTAYLCGAHSPGTGFNAGYNVAFWRSYTRPSFPYWTCWSWYERLDPAWNFGGDNNLKWYGFSTGGSIYELPNNWYIEFENSTFTSTSVQGFWHTNDDAGTTGLGAGGTLYGSSGQPNPCAQWVKKEIVIQWNSANTGRLLGWANNSQKFNYTGKTDGYSGTARSDGIGGYARNQTSNNWRYFADIYNDRGTSPGRFYLTNNATYTSSTINEIQPWTTWADGSVSLTCNKGSLPSGTVHLHYRNEAGTHQYIGTRTIS
jgi:hypothetical protein